MAYVEGSGTAVMLMNPVTALNVAYCPAAKPVETTDAKSPLNPPVFDNSCNTSVRSAKAQGPRHSEHAVPRIFEDFFYCSLYCFFGLSLGIDLKFPNPVLERHLVDLPDHRLFKRIHVYLHFAF